MTKFRYRLAVVCWLLLPIAAMRPAGAHGTFPDPDQPDFEETTLRDFAVARAAALRAGLNTQVAAADAVYASVMLWRPTTGQSNVEVSVCFWNGAPDVQLEVERSDRAWEGIAGISFNFRDAQGRIRICANAQSADIRISMDPNDARMDYAVGREGHVNWSLVGRSASFAPRGRRALVTINLPSVPQFLQFGDMENFHFIVRHETGHARGLLHEHQREICRDWFNIQAIADSQHWTVEKATAAVATFTQAGQMDYYRPVGFGTYDNQSIMQYNFAPGWYAERPGQLNPCRRQNIVSEPSANDLATLVQMYGARTAPAAASASSAPTPVSAAPTGGREGSADLTGTAVDAFRRSASSARLLEEIRSATFSAMAGGATAGTRIEIAPNVSAMVPGFQLPGSTFPSGEAAPAPPPRSETDLAATLSALTRLEETVGSLANAAR